MGTVVEAAVLRKFIYDKIANLPKFHVDKFVRLYGDKYNTKCPKDIVEAMDHKALETVNFQIKNTKIYLCIGGMVDKDGKQEFIDATKLPKLYGVNSVSCCYLPSNLLNENILGSVKYENIKNYIILQPTTDGVYDIDKVHEKYDWMIK